MDQFKSPDRAYEESEADGHLASPAVQYIKPLRKSSRIAAIPIVDQLRQEMDRLKITQTCLLKELKGVDISSDRLDHMNKEIRESSQHLKDLHHQAKAVQRNIEPNSKVVREMDKITEDSYNISSVIQHRLGNFNASSKSAEIGDSSYQYKERHYSESVSSHMTGCSHHSSRSSRSSASRTSFLVEQAKQSAAVLAKQMELESKAKSDEVQALIKAKRREEEAKRWKGQDEIEELERLDVNRKLKVELQFEKEKKRLLDEAMLQETSGFSMRSPSIRSKGEGMAGPTESPLYNYGPLSTSNKAATCQGQIAVEALEHDMPEVSSKQQYSRPRENPIPAMQTADTGLTSVQPTSSASSDHLGRDLQASTTLEVVSRSLADALSLSRLPAPEPTVFSGDPLLYAEWSSMFTTLIEKKACSTTENIYYLRRYVAGKAKDAINGYLIMGTSEAYDTARNMLKDRFGNKFIITEAFRDKLEAWPKITGKGGEQLQKFADFLQQCVSALNIMPELEFLNDNRENRKLVQKLPDWLVNRWARVVTTCKIEKGRYPVFVEFSDFISIEAKVASEPLTNFRSMPVVSNEVSGRQRNMGTTFSTSETSYEDHRCLHCRKSTGHSTADCQYLAKKSTEEKKKFVFDKRLCFGCLKKGHHARFFQDRSICGACGKVHPTSLHSRRPAVNESAAAEEVESEVVTANVTLAVLSNSIDNSSSAMTLPVWVSHKANPEKEIMVYALLDSQSDITFTESSIPTRLNAPTTRASLKLFTMTSKGKPVTCSKVDDLIIRGVRSKVKIPLSTAYTRDCIPVNKPHLPSPEKAQAWPHLAHLADQISEPLKCEAALLIGYNCAQALVPREVVSGTGSEPFAVRTDLGWSVVGSVSTSTNAVCHRICAKEGPQPGFQDMTKDTRLNDRATRQTHCNVESMVSGSSSKANKHQKSEDCTPPRKFQGDKNGDRSRCCGRNDQDSYCERDGNQSGYQMKGRKKGTRSHSRAKRHRRGNVCHRRDQIRDNFHNRHGRYTRNVRQQRCQRHESRQRNHQHWRRLQYHSHGGVGEPIVPHGSMWWRWRAHSSRKIVTTQDFSVKKKTRDQTAAHRSWVLQNNFPLPFLKVTA